MLALTLTALSLGNHASAETDIRESENVTLKLPTVFLSQGRGLLETRSTAAPEKEDTDRVEWYAPWPELSRFAVDEITSAALLEKSVVLVDHNRVALPLDVAR